MLDAIKTLHAELAAARAKVDETIKEAKTGRPSLDKEAAAAAIVAASVSELTTALVGVSGAFSAQFDTFQTSQDANTKAATKLQRWMVGLTWALFLAAAVQAVGMWIGHSTPPPIVMVVGATQK